MPLAGWWDPSATLADYIRKAELTAAGGFTGKHFFLAYPLKGVDHSEDVRIITDPAGGIFNPKSDYRLTRDARIIWR